MPPKGPSAASHFETVDALRGLSILAVVLFHIAVIAHFRQIPFLPWLPGWIVYPAAWNGVNAVRIFFVISGFLITTTSIKRFGGLGNMQIARFYRIRFARIAPLLLSIVLLLSIFHLLHVPGFTINTQEVSLLRAVIAVLTFHVNWVLAWRGTLPAGWDILWSLSVEEMFYFVFPLACVAFLYRRRGLPLFIAALFLFVVMGPFARTVWTTNINWQLWSYLGGMDGIAMGCLTALLTQRLRKERAFAPWQLATLQVIGIGLMLVAILWPHTRPASHIPAMPYRSPAFTDFLFETGLAGSAISLGTALVILASALHSKPATRWSAPFRWCGRYSYEIYMTHELILLLGMVFYHWFHRRVGFTYWIVPFLLSTLLVGWIVATYFTEPMNRWLRGKDPRVDKPSGADVLAPVAETIEA